MNHEDDTWADIVWYVLAALSMFYMFFSAL